MRNSEIHRRSFLQGALAAGLCASTANAEGKQLTRVAAVQMGSVIGDIDTNLTNAANWIHHAIAKGASWIVLPEFFASGMSFQPEKMFAAAEPIDGKPTDLLQNWAKRGGVHIGGSFLVQSGEDVYNTFVMATPDGRIFTHDKDFPSGYVEHAFYAGGEDEQLVKQIKKSEFTTLPDAIPPRSQNIKSGVFRISDDTAAGCAICWEGVRYGTATRLMGKVDLIVASSAWGLIDADVGVAEVDPNDLKRWGEQSVSMLRNMPRRLARLVGAPVIHANQVGSGWSQDAREGKPPMFGRAMGESQIVDAHGNVLARRPYSMGEGLVIAEVIIGRLPPDEEIPVNEFWMPDVTDEMKRDWLRGGASGRNYYLETTRPHRSGL